MDNLFQKRIIRIGRRFLRLSFKQYLTLAALIATEIFLIYQLCEYVKEKEKQVYFYNFESKSKEITASIQKEINLDLDKIKSLKALYSVSYPVSRKNFREYTHHIIYSDSNSSIQGLSWVPKIPFEKKDYFEKMTQREGFPEFKITERQANNMVAVAKRKEYYPVHYIEPMKGNEVAFGYDLGSHPSRLQAIYKANKYNQLAATERVKLVQANSVENGILVVFPFRHDGKLLGYFSGVFRIHDLISKSISHLPRHYFNIAAYDLSAGSGNQFLASLRADHNTSLREEQTFIVPDGLHFKQVIQMADRNMMILVTPSKAFLSLRTNISLLILILSIVISIGLCFHLIRYLKSENLLLNILPAPVALELKEKGRYEPRIFEKATILFCDFKDFTKIASQCNAKELVEEINYCFGEFDSIIEAFGIEKIKTVGDAYIAVGGLTDQGVQAAKKTVLAAIEMQKSLTARKSKNKKENRLFFEMRVGIHTGPIVAGIVGYTKFQYDIWGDTVNTASRLENLCEQGKVNISKATYELIHNDDAFSFEEREKQSVKGKGKLEMYYASEKGSIPFHRGQKIRKVIASQLFGSSEQLQA